MLFLKDSDVEVAFDELFKKVLQWQLAGSSPENVLLQHPAVQFARARKQ